MQRLTRGYTTSLMFYITQRQTFPTAALVIESDASYQIMTELHELLPLFGEVGRLSRSYVPSVCSQRRFHSGEKFCKQF